MAFHFVHFGWPEEISKAIAADPKELRIVCPFIKTGALERLICRGPTQLEVITRFNLNDFVEGVSDIGALRRIIGAGGTVRGIKNLHAKLYLFGSRRAILTSANLTAAALDRNHEFGVVLEGRPEIADCLKYFENLWKSAGENLTENRIKQWETLLAKVDAGGKGPDRNKNKLRDFGKDIGIPDLSPSFPPDVADLSQAFIKFIGKNDNRVPVSRFTEQIIRDSDCHRVLAYPTNKRPRAVRDGARMFVARLTSGPNDIRVFGRARGSQYRPKFDDATQIEIRKIPWKQDWPHYIRISGAEFVDGTLENGISLNELMDELGADVFATTMRHTEAGKGNTDPRRAYRQQAAVELSPRGGTALEERLEAAFALHGKVPKAKLELIS